MILFRVKSRNPLAKPSPGQPPKIVSQIEISQSNRHFKRIHVSHEIVGCNMSNAPSTTPLRAR